MYEKPYKQYYKDLYAIQDAVFDGNNWPVPYPFASNALVIAATAVKIATMHGRKGIMVNC